MLSGSPSHREAGAGRPLQRKPDFVLRVVEVDPVHVGARRHHACHGPVTQAQHARDHLPLVRFNDARCLRFGHQGLDVLFGDRSIRLLSATPKRRKIAFVEASSSQTTGADTRDTTVISGATAQAILSAFLRARCLGTSSPMMTERYVMLPNRTSP